MALTRTKAQIKAEINRETQRKLNQESELKNYSTALIYVNNLMKDIKNVKDNISSAEDILRKNFSSSGKKTNIKNLTSIRNSSNDIYNELRDKVKQRIDVNIKYFSSEISKTKSKISSLEREYNQSTM
ncbi:MAG: hypothetical protein PUD59_04015 [bacterium]|nr:hypothetical protein [bacterium]